MTDEQLENNQSLHCCDDLSTAELEHRYNQTKTKRTQIIYYTMFVLLTCGAGLCAGFITGLKQYLYIISILGVVAIGVATIVLYALKHEKLAKTGYLILILLLCFFAIYLILERKGLIEIFSDKVKLQEHINEYGNWAAPIFIIIQFLQATILPIPSSVTTIAGGLLFGEFLGSIYSLIGIIPASILAFLIGRYAGYKLVLWIVGKDTLIKTLKMIRGKDKIVITLMFLLPFFPDDVLCFVAGLSSMSFLYFSIMLIISRSIQVFTTTYFVTGGLIPFNQAWGIILWIIIGIAVVAMFYFSIKKGDKIEAFVRKFFTKSNPKNEFDFVDKVLILIEKHEVEKRDKLLIKLRQQQQKRLEKTRNNQLVNK